MGNALFVGTVVLTLVQVVISSESPVLAAAIIGGAVLLLVGVVETTSRYGTSDAGGERSSPQKARFPT